MKRQSAEKGKKWWDKYAQSLLMLWELTEMLIIKINKWDQVRTSQADLQLSVTSSVRCTPES